MRKIIVDKDSRVTIAANWAITAILIGCAAYFIKNLFILTPIILFLLAFAFFVFWFHRVPDRDTPAGDTRLVTSVADGKIVIVDRVYEKEYFKDDRIQVSIYMDFFDVHTNFWPMDGEISYYKYHPGKYWLDFPSEEHRHQAGKCSSSRSRVPSPEGLSATRRKAWLSREASNAASSSSVQELTCISRLTPT